MEGLLLIAFRADTEDGDPARAIRAVLEVAGECGLDKRYTPQVVSKRFDPEARPPFGNDLVLAQDAVRLNELGIDAHALGVDPVSESASTPT